MTEVPARRALIVVALAAALVQAARGLHAEPTPAAPPGGRATGDGAATFVGGKACASCHQAEAERWRGSHHDLAMQPADQRSVRGNFDNASFVKDGVKSTFFRRDGKYMLRTDGPDGKLHDYAIAYTFGVDPLQQYLIALPGGRLQAPSIAWDTRPAAAGGQRWFHLYPKEKIDYRDVLHWTGPAQNWNHMCADCHSTNVQKGYRAKEDRFDTTWSDVDVSCEACHGPGSRHVEWARNAAAGAAEDPGPLRGLVFQLKDTSGGGWTFGPGESIAHRSRPIASHVEVETCGRCHSRRSEIWERPAYGEPLAQTDRVALLDAGLYHADGQILDEVYEYGSFLQSRMYAAGVTCSNCHDPHSGHLRAADNGLCAQCHLPAKFDGPQHHFHKAGTKAARCVSCHMIERVYMVVDARRDHSFRVPRPELSEKLGTPNACNDCHRDKTSQWAAEVVTRWYGTDRRTGWHYGEALAAGRSAREGAEGELVRAIGDTSLAAIVRATAVSLLASYLGQRSLPELGRALADRDPLVRRAAADTASAVAPQGRLKLLRPLLDDPIRTVRLEALGSLLDLPLSDLSTDERAALARVIDEYREVQALNADRADAQVNLGMLESRLDNDAAAQACFETAIRLQPSFVPAYVNLADLFRHRDRESEAERTLRKALEVAPDAAEAREALGLSLVRQKRPDAALAELERAAVLRPDVAHYAYVYAVALHDTGDARRATEVLRKAHEAHPATREIVVALAEYAAQAGDRAAAIAWAQKLAEMSDDPDSRRLLQQLQAQ